MKTQTRYSFDVPTRTMFGAGTLNELHTQPMPGKKAMVVISNGKSTRANGYLDRTIEQLKLAGVQSVVFDKVQANPLKATVEEGGRFARENGCDFIVALGGGSCMDAAKGMAVMATNEGDLWDYIVPGTGKGKPIANTPLPIVAITTTAGTGSETDSGGVITNPETHEKTAIFGHDLFRLARIVHAQSLSHPHESLRNSPAFDKVRVIGKRYHDEPRAVRQLLVIGGKRMLQRMLARTCADDHLHSGKPIAESHAFPVGQGLTVLHRRRQMPAHIFNGSDCHHVADEISGGSNIALRAVEESIESLISRELSRH